MISEIIDCDNETARSLENIEKLIFGTAWNYEIIQEKIKNEANILESITDRSVKSVSMHNPSVFGEFIEVVGYKDAYQKPFFELLQKQN